jgi:hypothetical protein
MASAWGYSFGAAFGNAFGAIRKDDQHGGKRRRGHSEQDIRRLVDAKWEAIASNEASVERTSKPAPVIEQVNQPTGQSNSQPNNTQSDKQLARGQINPALDSIFNPQAAKPARLDAAAAPLLPSAAERAKRAKQRNDEEALLLILANL